MQSSSRDRNRGRETTACRLSSPSGLPRLLDQTARLVDSLSLPLSRQADALRGLLDRLCEQRFHLAILGQFKRGKSTLLNALLGEEALPVSVIPLTAIPTFIRAGDRRQVLVTFSNGDPGIEYAADGADELSRFLAQYVTEEANPRNRLEVSQVEVTHPAPILREGVVLIDTPGIGSTHLHNTEATLNFIPQCDAALFVVSPDPPVTEVEIDFLKEVRSRVSRLFFVLSKADYLGESDRDKMLDFLRSVFSEQEGVDADTPILPISARQGLEARQRSDAVGWEKSGMKDLESLLLEFLVHEKEAALSEAIARKASDLVGGILLEMRLSVQSLRMPLDELERRLETLEARLEDTRLQRTAESDMLEGDRKRMAALLEEQAEQLRRKARKRFLQVAREALEQNHLDTDAAQSALAEVIPGFFEHELGGMSRSLEARVRETLSRRRKHADDLVESVRRTAAELFDISYRSPTGAEEFEMKRQPYWVTHHWPVSLGMLPEGFWDRLLPYGMRKSRAFRRMRERIEVIVAENVENVRWPTLQNLQKSFREFGGYLDARLEEAISATIGAIRAGYDRRKDQSAEVESEIARVENEMAELEHMAQAIAAYHGVIESG
jgi:GTPase SAR1 family protein